MASVTEVERMIVRLMGDGSSYFEMLDTGVKESAKAEEAISNHTESIEEHWAELNKLVSVTANQVAESHKWEEVSKQVEEAQNKINEANKAALEPINNLNDAMHQYVEELLQVNEAQAASQGEQDKKDASYLDELGSAFEQMATEALDSVEAVATAAESTKELSTHSETLNDVLNDMFVSIAEGNGIWGSVKDALMSIGGTFITMWKEGATLSEMFAALKAATIAYSLSAWEAAAATWAAIAPFLAAAAPIAAVVAVIVAATAAILTLIVGVDGMVEAWEGLKIMVGYGTEEMTEAEKTADKFNKTLEAQLAAIHQTAGEQAYAKAILAGATEEQAKHAARLTEAIEEEKAATKAQEDHDKLLKKTTASLDEQLMSLSMTKAQMEEFKLVKQGLTEEEAKHARQVMEEIEAEKESIKHKKELVKIEEALRSKYVDTVTALDDKIKMMDMSKSEVAAYKAEQAGMNAEEIEAVRVLAEELDVKEKNTKATKELAKEEEKRLESITKSIEAIQKEAATIGMSAREKAIWELQQKHATTTQIEQAEALYDQIEAEKLLQKAEKDGNKLMEEMMTPLEKYQKKLYELAQLRELLGPEFEETFVRAVAAAKKEFDKANLKLKVGVEYQNKSTRFGSDEYYKLLSEVQMKPKQGEAAGGLASDEGNKELFGRIAVAVETMAAKPDLEVEEVSIA